MYKNIELRKLPSGLLYSVIESLETNSDWKKVLSVIPKDPLSERFYPKYNNEHVRLIEESSKATGKKCSEILFEEWGTSGRVRPTLNVLKNIVTKAGIYRAADEIAKIIGEEPPKRPAEGPAAKIDTGLTTILNNETNSQSTNHNHKVTRKIEDTIGKKTTAQIKSDEYPELNALHSFPFKPTAQMKSETDMIKFTNTHIPGNGITALQTSELPPFTEMINYSECDGEAICSEDVTASLHSSLGTSHIGSESSKQELQEIQVTSTCNQYQSSPPIFDSDSLMSKVDSSILHDEKLIHFEYEKLVEITNNFSETLTTNQYGPVGFIGKGGFGEVFVGYHEGLDLLAIKKAHNFFSYAHKPEIAMKIFNAEVGNLSRLQHNNIVSILGFSINGPALCIVCQYIDGGNLEEKIGEKVLSEWQRIKIMIGAAEGLKYLHKSEKKSGNDFYKTEESTGSQNYKMNIFVHGDVKSANILLTKDCIPKLCDFGLARQFDTTFMTTSPMGTSAYMAPEGFSGTITQKIDIYSFGIVLLELLTGLRPIIVTESERLNIKDYVEEKLAKDGITNILDTTVTDWKTATEIYALTVQCLVRNRKNRPSSEDICAILDVIKSKFDSVTSKLLKSR